MMNKNSIKKSIIIIFSLILIISMLQSTVFATDHLTDIKTALKPVNDDVGYNDKVGTVLNTVIGLLQVAGTGIALITISIAGIKYLLAAPGEKADIKKQIIPIVIGCILLFGAVNLMSAIYSFSQDVLK